MTVIKEGSFQLNLGLLQLSTKVDEQDRQCAWELYTEITTRWALVGKCKDGECKDFAGEVLSESLDSVHKFFGEARKIMRQFPVGKLQKKRKKKREKESHLGVLINDLMNNVLRPFLEKWQAEYRYWYEHQANQDKPPFERQKGFPGYDEFLKDWGDVRKLMRALRKELVKKYELVDVEELAVAEQQTEEDTAKK